MKKCGTAGQATDENTTRRMRIAYWITKALDKHSEYAILITFPQQKWLQEDASMLCYMYTVFYNPIGAAYYV